MKLVLNFKKMKKLPEWISILDAQVALNRSHSTIFRLIKTYNIKSMNEGKQRLINRDDLILKLRKMDNVFAEY